MGVLYHQAVGKASSVTEWGLREHSLPGHPCLFSVFLLIRKFVLIFSCPSYFSRGFGGRIESGWGSETRHTGQGSGSRLGCAQIYVLPIISVWEFCQKSWPCGPFCSLVSIVVSCFKWDANVIYSAWRDAVRENWTLQGRTKWSREGLRVSNMFLWVTKEQCSMTLGD